MSPPDGDLHVPEVLGADVYGLPFGPGHKVPPAQALPLGVADLVLDAPGAVNLTAMAEPGKPVPLPWYGDPEPPRNVPPDRERCCCCCRDDHAGPPPSEPGIPPGTPVPIPPTPLPFPDHDPVPHHPMAPALPGLYDDHTAPSAGPPLPHKPPPVPLKVLGIDDLVLDPPGTVNVAAMAEPGKPLPTPCCDDCAEGGASCCGDEPAPRDCCCCCCERDEDGASDEIPGAGGTAGSKPPLRPGDLEGEWIGPPPPRPLPEGAIAGEVPPDSRMPWGLPTSNPWTDLGTYANCPPGSKWAPNIGYLNGNPVNGCYPLPCPLPEGFRYGFGFEGTACGPEIPPGWNPSVLGSQPSWNTPAYHGSGPTPGAPEHPQWPELPSNPSSDWSELPIDEHTGWPLGFPWALITRGRWVVET